MIYSRLVDDVITTNKYSSRYGRRINSIVIHHMAGVMTAQSCANYFRETSRQVSANYTIGYDGSLVCNVYEDYRAWTTGSWEVDSGAITIEVSNDTRGPRWEVSNKALSTLIKLVADIAKRYNWSRVSYTGDSTGHLLKHEWYANTNCPGPYLGARFGYISREANKINQGVQIAKTSTRVLGNYRLNVDSIYIRQSPNGKKIGILKDKDIHVLEERNGGWGRLKDIGWVAIKYMDKIDDSYKAKLGTYELTVKSLYYRQSPNGKKLGIIKNDRQYTIVDIYGAWAKIKGYGWVAYQYFRKAKPKKSINTIAKEVIAGKWGNGDTRKARLKQAGYSYDEVQKEVNRLL